MQRRETHLLLVEVPLLVELAGEQRVELIRQPFKLAVDQALLLHPRQPRQVEFLVPTKTERNIRDLQKKMGSLSNVLRGREL